MQNLIELSKIFSDQNRVNILLLILRDKEVCVCEICDTLKLSQPLVSRHLKLMKESKILDGKKVGTWVRYTLVKETSSYLECITTHLRNLDLKLPLLVKCSI